MPQTKPSNEALFVQLIHDLDQMDGKADGRIITSEKMRAHLNGILTTLSFALTDNVMEINKENQRYTGGSPSQKHSSDEMRKHQERQHQLLETQSILMGQTTLITHLEKHLFKENQPDGAGYRIACADESLKEKLKSGNLLETLAQCVPQEGVPTTPAPASKKAPRKR